MIDRWREPTTFSAGDALIFERRLRDYPAGGGWYADYEIRGATDPISFQSTPDGDDHSINVASATTLAWAPGNYVLVGYAVLTPTGERHQFYYGELCVTQNFQTLPGQAIVETHYARMVRLLQAMMEGTATHDIKTSKVEGTTIERYSRQELYDLYAKYYQLLQNEIDGERARNGQPSRNKVRPFFNITTPGNVFGEVPNSTGFFPR